jgi:hypothetical protein
LDDIVLYFVQVRENATNAKWRFKTRYIGPLIAGRYSDLRDIHTALKDSKLSQLIPEFPKRKIFGITNESPNKIETRKQKLEIYLNEVFRYLKF